jgi:hypothetical protein
VTDVLVIDDAPAVAASLAHDLSAAGYRPRVALTVAADTPSLNTGATVMYLGRSIFGGERATCRVMTVAIYSAALTDAQWAQVMAHARAAHGVR